jgi:hypothetical protein
MSYCRLSVSSDAYVFEDVSGGWTTHITSHKSHPEAISRFNHETPKLCAENLIRLCKEGFRIPKHAINTLLEEGKEEQA